ncbi:hypothetical protein FO519_003922 [Halicephalobus sp. NKZ332]|nr:hypothetical protein FO519_003922 [Halicephalobus sp. NKZ332]
MLPHMNHHQLNLLQLQSFFQQLPIVPQNDVVTAYSNLLQQQQLQEQYLLQYIQQQQASQDLLNVYQQMILTPKESFQTVISPKIENLQEPSSIDTGCPKKRKNTPETELETKRPCSSSSTLATPVISGSSTPQLPGPIKQSSSQSDTEAEEFIDVVGDPVPKTKAQRKAHIEFYRKLKLLRNREKNLQCSLCSKSVKNIENDVRAHVTSHAEASILICRLCSHSTRDLHQMFQHMGTAHPNHRTCYEDRRNMTQLSEILSTCFPRSGLTKQKNGIQDLVHKILENSKKNQNSEIICEFCKKLIPTKKESLMKHINLHHVYRCKKCKNVQESEEEMRTHVQNSHEKEDPKMGSDYHISAAAEALTGVFRKCFQKYLDN